MTEIIAEIVLQHDGSLRECLAFVRACAARGVDCVKAQCHLGNPNAHFRKGTEHHFPQDESRFRYWQRTGFQKHEWERIKQECDDCGVEFLCTPFSVAAAEMINPLVKRWKIGSGNVQDSLLIEYVIGTGKSIVFSNGFGEPVHRELRQRASLELACISKYPTPLNEAIKFMDELKASLHWGWSSHTGTIIDSINAARYGAAAIEVHVCWHKEQGGPDVASAIDMSQLELLVANVRSWEHQCAEC